MSDFSMTPTRPYFLRAVYQWIVDNNCTPYLAVDATVPNVQVPSEYVADGKIILNLAPEAIAHLVISNSSIVFSARFAGKARNIDVPVSAVLGIYAKENGQGMAFAEDEYDGADIPPEDNPEPPRPGRPSLKVVK